MKAIICTKFGPPEVLELREVEKPGPRANELLVKIHAASINFGDTLVRNFREISPGKFHMPFLFWLIGKIYFGFRKPRIEILGSEFSGEIESVGNDVKLFRKGDQVFGYSGPRMGAYAEYICMPENGVVALKPAGMTYEEAAAVPYGGIMAWNLLRSIDLRPGQKVLINGASGGIGPALVQLAKSHFGAIVSGVCGTARIEYVAALGAEKVIDYTKEDFADRGERYDCIFDILGKSSFARCKVALRPDGRLFYISFKMKQVFQMLWTSLTGGKKAVCVVMNEKAEDLDNVRKLIEAGKLKAMIDKCYPLEQAAEAHRYAEEGRKNGNVVLFIKQNTGTIL